MCCNETIEKLNRLNDSLRFTLILVCGMPLIAIGIFSSILSFGMFLKDNMTPKTTKTMLMVTAMLDLLFLILAFFYLELKVLSTTFNLANLELFYKQTSTPVSVLLNWCEMFRNWITVMIGLERYLIICHALDFKKWWNLKVTRLGILICSLISIVLRIPHFISVTTKNKYKEISDLLNVMHDWIDAIFMTITPIFILLICSFAIAKQIRNLSANLSMSSKTKETHENVRASSISISRSQFNNTSRIDRVRTRVHKMLMVVLIIFTVCGTPFVINAIVKIIAGDLSLSQIYNIKNNSDNSTSKKTNSSRECSKAISKILSVLCWFCSIIYSTTNFFVYVCYFKKYRQIIYRMLICQWGNNDDYNDYQLVNPSMVSVRGRLMSTSDCYSSRLSICSPKNDHAYFEEKGCTVKSNFLTLPTQKYHFRNSVS